MPMDKVPRDIAEQLSRNAMEARERMGGNLFTRAYRLGDPKAREAYYRIIDGRHCSIAMLVRVARLLDTTASELLEGVA